MGLNVGMIPVLSNAVAFLRIKAASLAEPHPPAAESHLLSRPEPADPITASCAFSHRCH
jgi:hypothetical protein